jgi:hypothetical protein
MPKEFVSGGCPGKVARRHDRGDHESLAVKLIDIVLVPRRIDFHEQFIPSTPQCLLMRNGEAGDRRVTRRAGSVRNPTRRRLQRWRARRHEPRCVAVSVARGRDERNGHQHSDRPVLGRHNSIPRRPPQLGARSDRRSAVSFLASALASRLSFTVSRSTDAGESFADFRATTFLSKNLLLQWVPGRGLRQRKQCVVGVV